jgi:hypothetical protein
VTQKTDAEHDHPLTVNWTNAVKIDRVLQHAEVLSKYPGDSCQSSLHLDIGVEMQRKLASGSMLFN